MKTIKIDFCDFWGGYNKTDNYFFNLLKEKFDVQISDDPDYVFFSVFGSQHQKYNCCKIQYVGENIPPADYADYTFSFDYSSNIKNYRLPHYLLYDGYYDLVNKKVDDSLLNRKFCNIVVSNGNCNERNSFFHKLSRYKMVDSGGRYANNIGYPVGDKRKFQSEYKFSITYENNAYRPGYEWYITEKPFEAMCSNSIPIYKGGSEIKSDFNTKSFVNAHDFKSEEEMIDYIIYLDQNDSEYMKVMREPWFVDNNIPENNRIDNIKSFLYKIFE